MPSQCTFNAHFGRLKFTCPFEKYVFARLCEGKCKPSRTKSHIPTKNAYLTRFPSHAFFAPISRQIGPRFSAANVVCQKPTFRRLYTTPSGLNSSQTPDIVSQRQRHGQVKSKNPTLFDAPVQA